MLQARFHRNFRNYKKSLQSPRCSLRNILMNKHDPPKSSLALMKSNSGDFFVRSEPHTSRQHECQRSLLISRTVKCTNETGTCTLDFSVIGVLRVSNWKRFESIGWTWVILRPNNFRQLSLLVFKIQIHVIANNSLELMIVWKQLLKV